MAQNSNLAVDNRLGIHRLLRANIDTENTCSFDLTAGTAVALTGAASTPGALSTIKPGLFAVEYDGYISIVVINTTAVTELVSSVRKPTSTTDNTYTAANGTGTLYTVDPTTNAKPGLYVDSSILYLKQGSGGSAVTVRISRIF